MSTAVHPLGTAWLLDPAVPLDDDPVDVQAAATVMAASAAASTVQVRMARRGWLISR
jgi:hypothetical protein